MTMTLRGEDQQCGRICSIAKVCLHSLQNDELDLILHDFIPPTARQLRNTIGTPDGDRDVSSDKSNSEQAEFGRLQEFRSGEWEV